MAYKEKLQKRFEELDKKEHIDYRMIAFQLWLDYHKLDTKYKKSQKETETTKKELEEKQEQLDAIFNWIAELYDMIEEREIDYWTIDWTSFILEELARIQNYCK